MTSDMSSTGPTSDTTAVEHHIDLRHETLDDTEGGEFSDLDRTYGRSVAAGYVGGFAVILTFMIIVLFWATEAWDIPAGAVVASAAAVAVWIGIMGGVVAVGMWATKHEEDLHG